MHLLQTWIAVLTAAALPASALLSFPDCIHGPLANNAVCNTSASPSERAAALVKAMTIDEKLVNLVNTVPGAPRLGMPPYEWWSEALHGVAGSPGVTFNRSSAGINGNGNPPEFAYATSFASPITLSAAFDDDLVERVADIVSTEARAFSNAGRAGLDYWTPNINPYKDPRWGRGSETPGEDPTRIRGYVRSLLKGLERYDGHSRKVIATCKHFAAYDLERWNGTVRYGFDAVVSLQDLSEYYLPAFQECARDSHVGSVMCSYNSLNGTPACASTYLMQDILRGHWGWTDDSQYVTSDCNAVLNFDHEHKYSVDGAHAAAAAYSAGTDTVCEVPQYGGTDVRGAYNQSLLSEKVVDRALARLYEGLVRVGYFDSSPNSNGSLPYRSLRWKDVGTAAARKLAWQSAADGIVLKKNLNSTVPLDVSTNSSTKSIALIGYWADATHQMLGGYSGIPPYYHNAVEAAKQRNWTVHVFGGNDGAPVDGDPSKDTWTVPALEAAHKSDVVLYFGGTDLSVAAEDKDRNSIALPQVQLDLVNALASLGKPLVVVQLGDQTDDTPLLQNSNVSAILWAGYPGQDGGSAVLDIVAGVHAPAGRLPVTQYPSNYTSAVPMTDMSLRPSALSPGRTYRWYEHAVLPFGHGLHYTSFTAVLNRPSNSSTFAISDLMSNYKDTHPDLCHFANINASITNTGNKTTSDFVALLFVSGSYGPKPYPMKTLVAYERVRNIKPQTSSSASLRLTLGSLARTDESGNLVLYPGTYTLSLDVPTQSSMEIELTGNAVVLDKFPQPAT